MTVVPNLMPTWWQSRNRTKSRRRWFLAGGSATNLGVHLLCDNGVSVRWVPWDELQRNWEPCRP